MNDPVYEIYEKNGTQMIRRNKFPRFTAKITFNSQIGDFEDVIFEDSTTPLDAAKAMNKASEFMIKIARYGRG